jgi:CRISPR-associated protein Cmr2
MKTLLVVAVGPVQDFIAAARRTRDLWFGSYVLSEISKAVARRLSELGAELIFPCPENTEDLAPESTLKVANKIVTEISASLSNDELKSIVSKAREAAQQRWLQFAEDTYNDFFRVIDKEIWDDQIHDVIEFFAAWVQYSDGNYSEALKNAERLLAGRKALKDFVPAKGRFGVPKSSLDGQRESVLTNVSSLEKELRRKLKIKETEHLDAIGLVKRVAEKKSFLSVTRIAADPWIRGLNKDEKGKEFFQRLIDVGLKYALIEKLSYPEKLRYPYDYSGSFFFPSRLNALIKENQLDDAVKEEVEKIWNQEIAKSFGEPSPYYAILIADGDRMGAVISKINSVQRHREFTRKLSKFAGEAEKIVKDHHGVLIYSGGDDVMAFLPVDQCIEAAQELHDKFGELLKDFPTKEENKKESPTLSVGITIVHNLEPLDMMLELARKTEQIAKHPDRDGLAITFQARNGEEPLTIREKWEKDPGKDLLRWAEIYMKGELSSKAAYDLIEIARDYKGWEEKSVPPELLRSDTLRMFKRKRSKEGPLSEEVMQRIEQLLNHIDNANDLEMLAKKLIIAQHIAESKKQAREILDTLQEDIGCTP